MGINSRKEEGGKTLCILQNSFGDTRFLQDNDNMLFYSNEAWIELPIVHLLGCVNKLPENCPKSTDVALQGFS